MQKLKKEVVMMSIKQKLTGKPSIDRPWMLTLTVKTVNHARIFFIFLIVPPSHELMC